MLLVTSHPDKIWVANKLKALDLPRFRTTEWTGTYLALSPAPNRFHISMAWSERDLKQCTSNTKTSVSFDWIFALPPGTAFYLWRMSLASTSSISEFSSGFSECASPQNISHFRKSSVCVPSTIRYHCDYIVKSQQVKCEILNEINFVIRNGNMCALEGCIHY